MLRVPIGLASTSTGKHRLQSNHYQLEGAIVGCMETGNDVRLTPARLGRLLNWQAANFPIAGSEPRKLFAPVRSRSKHASYGIPLMRAQMASPLTRSVPGGSVAYCVGPLPPKRNTPPTEPSA